MTDKTNNTVGIPINDRLYLLIGASIPVFFIIGLIMLANLNEIEDWVAINYSDHHFSIEKEMIFERIDADIRVNELSIVEIKSYSQIGTPIANIYRIKYRGKLMDILGPSAKERKDCYFQAVEISDSKLTIHKNDIRGDKVINKESVVNCMVETLNKTKERFRKLSDIGINHD